MLFKGHFKDSLEKLGEKLGNAIFVAQEETPEFRVLPQITQEIDEVKVPDGFSLGMTGAVQADTQGFDPIIPDELEPPVNLDDRRPPAKVIDITDLLPLPSEIEEQINVFDIEAYTGENVIDLPERHSTQFHQAPTKEQLDEAQKIYDQENPRINRAYTLEYPLNSL